MSDYGFRTTWDPNQHGGRPQSSGWDPTNLGTYDTRTGQADTEADAAIRGLAGGRGFDRSGVKNQSVRDQWAARQAATPQGLPSWVLPVGIVLGAGLVARKMGYL